MDLNNVEKPEILSSAVSSYMFHLKFWALNINILSRKEVRVAFEGTLHLMSK